MKLPSFPRAAALWALLLTGALYWPIALGKTPFPETALTNFPLFDGVRPALVSPGRMSNLGDQVTFYYPWSVLLRRTIREGGIPLWNRHVLLGAPFLADLQSAVFYPPNLALSILPASLAWGLAFCVRTFLAVFFAAILAREIGVSLAGSLAAGAIYGLSGFLTTWSGFSATSDTAVWLPALLWAAHRLLARPNAKSIVAAAIAFGMPMLAGHPEVVLAVVLTACLYWLYLRTVLSVLDRRPLLPDLLRFLSVGFLALGLTAIVWIPAAEWLTQIRRTLVIWIPFSPGHIVGLLSRETRTATTAFGLSIPEQASYAGALALLAAPLALFAQPRRQAAFFVVTLVVAALVIFGITPVGMFLGRLPLVGAIPKGRCIPVLELSLAMLAGLGLSAIDGDSRTRSLRRRIAMGAVVALGAAGAAGVLLVLVHRYPRSLAVGILASPRLTLVFLGLSAATLLAPLAARSAGPGWRAAVLALTALDLVTFAYGSVPFVPRSAMIPTPVAYGWLRKHDRGTYRVASVDLAASENAEVIFGMESPCGYDFALRTTSRFLAPLAGGPPQSFVTCARSEAITGGANPRLDLSNVKYLIATTLNPSASRLEKRPDSFRLVFSRGRLRVFENLRALPRAFLVPPDRAVNVASDDEADTFLSAPDFDPRNEATVHPPGIPPAVPPPGVPGSSAEVVSVVSESTNALRLASDTGKTALLVVSQAYYPGWRARVDGASVPLLRVDLSLTGLLLPPGRHDIRLQYRPASFAIGLGVSATALLILGWLGMRRARALREPDRDGRRFGAANPDRAGRARLRIPLRSKGTAPPIR